MTYIYYVDFKRKTLIGKKEIEESFTESDLDKYNYFCEMIDQGLTQVVVNTNIDEVKVPSYMMGQTSAKINWSHKFYLPDFSYDKRKVSGTLSFNKKPFYVEIPWASIWLMGRPEVFEDTAKYWPDDMPDDVADELKKETDNNGALD